MASMRRWRKARRSAGLVSAILACILGALACSVAWVAAPAARSVSHIARHAEAAAEEEKPKKAPIMWKLVIYPTDHYLWRDEANFVAVLGDAGEWTLDVDTIKATFKQANETGQPAEVFTAPRYVVKDYIKELRAYGLQSQGIEVDPSEVSEGDEKWRRKSWKELSPDQKDLAGKTDAEIEAEKDKGKARIVVLKNDHAVYGDQKRGKDKFRAYIEMACDKAKRFAPEEDVLNWCYKKIKDDNVAKAVVIQNMKVPAAELAIESLTNAGFLAEIEIAEKTEEEEKAEARRMKAEGGPEPTVQGQIYEDKE